jgi:hypothetical protein
MRSNSEIVSSVTHLLLVVMTATLVGCTSRAALEVAESKLAQSEQEVATLRAQADSLKAEKDRLAASLAEERQRNEPVAVAASAASAAPVPLVAESKKAPRSKATNRPKRSKDPEVPGRRDCITEHVVESHGGCFVSVHRTSSANEGVSCQVTRRQMNCDPMTGRCEAGRASVARLPCSELQTCCRDVDPREWCPGS